MYLTNVTWSVYTSRVTYLDYLVDKRRNNGGPDGVHVVIRMLTPFLNNFRDCFFLQQFLIEHSNLEPDNLRVQSCNKSTNVVSLM